MKTNLKGIKDLDDFIVSIGEKPYRANQIWKWLWLKGVADFDSMTDISKSTRTKLDELCYIGKLELADRRKSKIDGSEKFLFVLKDGSKIESVLIPDRRRTTVCISTQVGCSLSCTFCATGEMDYTRDLKWWEIADQIVQIKKLTHSKITNVVMMGMGEPFLNYDEVISSARFINKKLQIGARKIAISTAGIVPGIRKFAAEPEQFKLAISLNSTSDRHREVLMPINRKYPIVDLIKAVRYYTRKKRKKVTFEYVLIRDINDSPDDALSLAKLLKGIPCKINLIPYNRIGKAGFEPPSKKCVERFRNTLYKLCPTTTIRESRGSDIKAACGQLKTESR